MYSQLFAEQALMNIVIKEQVCISSMTYYLAILLVELDVCHGSVLISLFEVHLEIFVILIYIYNVNA